MPIPEQGMIFNLFAENGSVGRKGKYSQICEQV